MSVKNLRVVFNNFCRFLLTRDIKCNIRIYFILVLLYLPFFYSFSYHTINMGVCSSGHGRRSRHRAKVAVKPMAPIQLFYSLSEVDDFKLLGLTDVDIEAFFEVFYSLNPDKLTRTINMYRMLDGLGLSDFDYVACKLFSKETSSTEEIEATLSFREFLLYSWRFLTLNRKELKEYSFSLYDEKGCGLLTTKTVLSGILLVYNNNTQDYQHESHIFDMCHIIEETPTCAIDLPYYMKIIDELSMFVQPLFTIQQKMREVLLGHRFWQLREVQSVRLKRSFQVQHLFEQTNLNSQSRIDAAAVATAPSILTDNQGQYTQNRPRVSSAINVSLCESEDSTFLAGRNAGRNKVSGSMETKEQQNTGCTITAALVEGSNANDCNQHIAKVVGALEIHSHARVRGRSSSSGHGGSEHKSGSGCNSVNSRDRASGSRSRCGSHDSKSSSQLHSRPTSSEGKDILGIGYDNSGKDTKIISADPTRHGSDTIVSLVSGNSFTM